MLVQKLPEKGGKKDPIPKGKKTRRRAGEERRLILWTQKRGGVRCHPWAKRGPDRLGKTWNRKEKKKETHSHSRTKPEKKEGGGKKTLRVIVGSRKT